MGVDARLDSLVAGYRVERLLGRGGMGAVYLADDVQLGRKVALKLLVPELSEDAGFRERFLRESRIAAGLEHPNVVPIYQAGDADGTLFIAMRYVEGTDLKRLLADAGRLDRATIASVASQVAAALDAAHEADLVHRDVKPGNVLIDRREHVYLTDFGLTKQTASQSGLTATGTLVGTLDYVSPEQIQGQTVDGRADVYSLACLLHECLTGTPPFRRETDVATLWAHINDPPPTTGDPAVDAVLVRGLAKQPEDRYPNAGELAADLRRALDVPSGETPVPNARRRLSRRLFAAAIVVAFLVVVPAVALLAGRGGGSTSLNAIPPQSLGLIDPRSGRVVAALHVGPTPTRAAIGAGSVWIASGGDGTLLRIDPTTHRVVKTIGLGFHPADIAAAPRSVFLADPAHVSIVRVDTDSNVVSEATPVTRAGSGTAGPTPGPEHIVFGSTSVWGDAGYANTSVIRLRTPRNLVDSVDLGSYTADSLAFADGALWIADFSNGVVVRVSPARNVVAATVRLGTGADAPFATALGAGASGVWAVGVTPEGGLSNAPDYSRVATIFRIDPHLGGVVASVRVGHQNPGGSRGGFANTSPTNSVAVGEGAVWVANGGDGTLMKIDPARNAVVNEIQVGNGVDGVTIGEGYVWVSRP